MKTLRKLLAVATLTFVFAHAAPADDGIIHGDAPATPPADTLVNTQNDAATLTEAAVEFVRVALDEMLALG